MTIRVNGVEVGGGGSASLPDDPAAVLLDAGAPSTFVALDAAGIGTSWTAAEATAVLVPQTRTAVADTGWTDVVTGTGSAAHASGVHTLSVGASGSVLAHRAVSGVVAEAPELELVGRLLVTTGAPGTAWWAVLSLGDSADTNAVIAQVKETGQVQLLTVVAGTAQNHVTSAFSLSLTSGNGWVRGVVRPSYFAVYYGTGSGATAPTSWTLVGSITTPPTLLAGGLLTRVGLRVGRNWAGSGSYVVEWRNVQTRALGLVP